MAGGENSVSEAFCDGHLTVIFVLVVGAGPINKFSLSRGAENGTVEAP